MSQGWALKFRSAIHRGGWVLEGLIHAEGFSSPRDEVLDFPFTIVGKIAVVGYCVMLRAYAETPWLDAG